ncbi:MAG: C39 family peptidase [Erysipelotrichaceae bacterium]
MKNVLIFMIFGMFLLPLGATEILANDEGTVNVPEGFDSEEQYEQVPDYYDAKRVSAREEKLKKIDNYKFTNRANIYTISLPLRGQQNESWCAPASGEMIIDYQLGSNNIWTQEKIAKAMKTTSLGTTAGNAATALRDITGLNFEVQRISSLPLINALQSNINSYVGLMLLVDTRYLYVGSGGGHAVAAKGYSDNNTVIYLDPWKYDKIIYGQHEVPISTMTSAISGAEGLYIW